MEEVIINLFSKVRNYSHIEQGWYTNDIVCFEFLLSEGYLYILLIIDLRLGLNFLDVSLSGLISKEDFVFL